MELSTGSVTVQELPKTPSVPYKNPGDVEFEVKYPKDYKGVKHMPEGAVTISKESAEQFTAMGIGKVVETKEAEAAKTEETDPKGGSKKK
jgi:hypothetical protein